MVLALLIKNGPLAGQNYPLADGATIGRQKGATIFINDSKMSRIHAFLEFSADRGWLIKDNGSTNKVLVGNERFDEYALMPGVEFWLGKTQFEVVDQKSLLSDPWQELVQLTNTATSKSKNEHPAPINWFKFPLKLTFQRGSQLGSTWLVEYGPRQFGSKVLDFVIEDELCPDQAFEISNATDGPTLTTKYPDIVTVDSRKSNQFVLKDGDIIQVRYNTIAVEIKNV